MSLFVFILPRINFQEFITLHHLDEFTMQDFLSFHSRSSVMELAECAKDPTLKRFVMLDARGNGG